MGVLPLTAVARPVTPMRSLVVMRLDWQPAVPVAASVTPMRSLVVLPLD
jgi:hypothetical protein